MIPRRPAWPAAALVAVLSIGACSPILDTRGYVPDAAALDQITPGGQTRADVAALLGTPSSVAPFSDDTWIYIQRKTETIAFFTPKVVEQNVVVVEFDGTGLVRDVRRYTLADGQVIDPVTRTTPAPGKELTLLEQLIGNIGRFNAPNDTIGSSRTPQ